MKKLLIILQILIFQITIVASDQIISFEEGVNSSIWKVENGKLTTSTKHYKHQSNSLQWDWNKGSKLIANSPEGFEKAAQSRSGGIRIWVYNEVALNDKVTFNFYDLNGVRRCYFDFKINFKGWRAVWVRYRDDLKYYYSSSNALKKMEIIAPRSVRSGTLFFDLLVFSRNISWRRTSDYQYSNGKKAKMWEYLNWTKLLPQESLPLTITKKQENDFKIISERYLKWMLGTDKYLDNKYFKLRKHAVDNFIVLAKSQYNNIKIDVNGDDISGTPLFSSRDYYYPKFSKDISENIFIPLVLDYKLNGNVDSKNKIIKLINHFNDQGWADGSALGTCDHETIRATGWMHTIMLLKDELKDEGILEREANTLNWYSEFNKSFATKYEETTADDLRSLSLFKLFRVLLMDSSPKKVQFMKSFINWFNKALEITPGWAGVIKSDFMGFHHRGVYGSAYSPAAFHTSSLVSYLINGTSFDINKNSKSNLKNALKTLRIVANDFETPISINGRMPRANNILVSTLPAFAYFAINEKEDNKMTQIFKRLWKPNLAPFTKEFSSARLKLSYFNSLGAIEIMLDVASKIDIAEKSPQGFWSKPNAGLAIHRRDNWLVSVRGYSQYVFNFESSGNENIYGRYNSYGVIQIMSNKDGYISSSSNGYNVDKGWDWSRWPGSTYIYKTSRELDYNIKKQHRNFSESTFVGASTIENRNGVWAMELTDPTFDPSFRAKKSVFFFDNHIICLGSDIYNSDFLRKTETTIFQSWISDNSKAILVNEKLVKEFPYDYKGSDEKLFLKDPYNRAYYFPTGKNVIIKRGVQNSMFHTGAYSTSGSYSTAWINHGKFPENANYEYTIIIDPKKDDKNLFFNNCPYQVLQKDENAHIVSYPEKNTTAYAIFNSAIEINKGLVKSVDRPVLVICKVIDDKLKLSLCDPDFRRPYLLNTKDIDEYNLLSPSKPAKTKITLVGKWKLSKPYSSVKLFSTRDNYTTFEFNCKDAKNYEVDIIDHNATSISNNSIVDELLIYPNPVLQGNSLIVKCKKNINIEVEIYSVSGTRVYYNKNKIIHSINLPTGVYILVSGQVRRKVIFI